MGLDSARIALKENLDKLEAKQKNDPYMERLRAARATNRKSVDRLDSLLGKREICRAIEKIRPRLAEVESEELRIELDLILTAAEGHLQ